MRNKSIYIIILLIAAYLVSYHISIILYPYPLAPRGEGAAIHLTKLISRGVNPFTISSQPLNFNVYGILYNAITLSFYNFTESSFIAHRFTSALFILMSCFVVYVFCPQKTRNNSFTLLCVLLLYASLLCSVIPLAQPDSLGLFLFLLALYIPEKYNYSPKAIFISIIVGSLAFYTKTFFLLYIIYLSAYLFCFISKKVAILHAIASSFVILISSIILYHFCDAYFINTFITHINAANFSILHLAQQLGFFCICYFGIFLALYCQIKKAYPKLHPGIWFSIFDKFNFKDLNRPLIIIKYPPAYCYVVISISVVIFKLGGHTGAWMSYLYELITPFLIIATIQITQDPVYRLKTNLVMCLNIILFSVFVLPHYSYRDYSYWPEIKAYLAPHKKIFNSPALVSIMLGMDKAVFDSGQTFYFHNSYKYNFLHKIKIISKSANSLKRQHIKYDKMIGQMIKESQFDVIAVYRLNSKYLHSFNLSRNYYLDRKYEIYLAHLRMNQNIEFWKPYKINTTDVSR